MKNEVVPANPLLDPSSPSTGHTALPRQVLVESVVRSRYGNRVRPLSWDRRTPGLDEIETSGGEKILLASTGGQSTPEPGWILLLTGETAASSVDSNSPDPDRNAYRWTLYGIPKGH